MIFYLKNNEIVARSYKTQRGFIFDIGTQFKKREHSPLVGNNHFYITEHHVCENLKVLKSCINLFEKKIHAKLKVEDVCEENIKSYIDKNGI